MEEVRCGEKCPYCKGEMEQGYIQCRDSIWWAKKKHFSAALSGLCKTSVRLAANEFFSEAAVEAYLCRLCKKIVIDYSKK